MPFESIFGNLCVINVNTYKITVMKIGNAELTDTRKELVKWINSIQDGTLLGLLTSVKLSSDSTTTDWWETLTEGDKNNISEGLKDLEEGRTLTSKEFWNGLKDG